MTDLAQQPGRMSVWIEAMRPRTLPLAIASMVMGLFLDAADDALNWTVAGRMPYGYVGLEDIAVLIFFGWIGVLGSYYVQAQQLSWHLILPATSSGLLTVAVLNVNNIRDLESDKKAGKFSIPVRLEPHRARLYHWGYY